MDKAKIAFLGFHGKRKALMDETEPVPDHFLQGMVPALAPWSFLHGVLKALWEQARFGPAFRPCPGPSLAGCLPR